MTGRGTALLLSVVIGLVAYLWIAERFRPAPAAGPAQLPLLLEPDAGAVARLEIEDAEGRLTATRRDASWTDDAGRPWKGSAVTDLVETLGSLRPVMVVDARPEDPAAYGLGTTAQRLHVAGGDGRTLLALEIGERNPAWTGIYVRRRDRPEVILVGAVLRWELEKLRRTAPGG